MIKKKITSTTKYGLMYTKLKSGRTIGPNVITAKINSGY